MNGTLPGPFKVKLMQDGTDQENGSPDEMDMRSTVLLVSGRNLKVFSFPDASWTEFRRSRTPPDSISKVLGSHFAKSLLDAEL
ncbi:hypothetical protein RIR_jg7830.t1 [Rhizophagus irregularis DAOM 181602=DAOM 197198]|nr:hypothetical protein RIR_jg7830.t1 [Rhizophagus irregularis DAOM 181602=DAOM 197198]